MDFDALEKSLKEKNKKHFFSSLGLFLLIVLLVIVGFSVSLFLISILILAIVIFVIVFFFRHLIGLVRNHKTLVDIWDEKILVHEKMHKRK